MPAPVPSATCKDFSSNQHMDPMPNQSVLYWPSCERLNIFKEHTELDIHLPAFDEGAIAVEVLQHSFILLIKGL